MGLALGSEQVGTQIVIARMEDHLFPFWVKEEIAIASANGAVTAVDFVIH